jgi:three-Cys-motif partner protein
VASHDEGFFSESSEQSRVKASIVADYFFVWAKVIIPTARQGDGKIGYIDLYAGAGRYEDGTKSTPLKIIERAIADADMRRMLVATFNDAAEDHAESLEKAIKSLRDVETLKHKPKVFTAEVGDEVVELFDKMRLIPTFTFIDPYGYKGLSLPLIRAFLKDWGSDCVFFFNYNRINMGLDNPVVDRHMRAIFGDEGTHTLRAELDGLGPAAREEAIMDALIGGLQNLGGKYVLPFRFRRETGRVSHYLIFVSKHFRGYERMKDIMAKHSSATSDGVASFEYDPRGLMELPFESPLDLLKRRLLKRYRGSKKKVRAIFEDHTMGTPYTLRNYKEALKGMEASRQIQANPPAKKRRKNTLADDVTIIFPPK